MHHLHPSLQLAVANAIVALLWFPFDVFHRNLSYWLSFVSLATSYYYSFAALLLLLAAITITDGLSRSFWLCTPDIKR